MTSAREAVLSITSVPAQRRSRHIPRLLHQICIQRSSNLHAEVEQSISALKAANSEFTHHLWNNKDIYDALYEWYGFEVLAAYLRINPRYGAAQADFFRYCLMYKTGGVYLDLKSGASRPLSQIIEDEDAYLLSQWPSHLKSQGWGLHHDFGHIFGNSEFLQWFIICQAGHPYLAAVIDRVLRRIHDYDKAPIGGTLGVVRTTGPVPYTLAIHDVQHEHAHRIIDAEAEGLVFRRVHAPLFGKHYSTLSEDVIL